MRVLVRLILCLDGVKRVAVPNAFLCLVREGQSAKRLENVKRRSDAASDQASGSNWPGTGSSSEVQVIIILSSPKTGSNDHLNIGDDALGDLGEAALTPPSLQMIPPPIQVGSWPGKSEFTRTGLKRSSLPDRILTNSYLPARGLVSVPRLEDVEYIVRHWNPFN